MDRGEPDKSSEDGNFQASPLDQQSQTTTPSHESTSEETLQSTMNNPQQTAKKDESQIKIADGISPLEWKKRGNVYFGKEDWEQASHSYRSGLKALREQRFGSENGQSPLIPSSAKFNEFLADPVEVALRSNMAFVLLKLQHYDQAEEECNQLLKISPTNIKGKRMLVHGKESLAVIIFACATVLYLRSKIILSPLYQQLFIDGRVHVRASTFHSTTTTTILKGITLWIPLAMITTSIQCKSA